MASRLTPRKIIPADATPSDEIRAQFTQAAADIDAGIAAVETGLGPAGGALSLLTKVSMIAMTGGTDGAFTLADGVAGQTKVVILASRASTGNAVITPANFGNGTTITLDAAFESVTLHFDGTNWYAVSGTNTIA